MNAEAIIQMVFIPPESRDRGRRRRLAERGGQAVEDPIGRELAQCKSGVKRAVTLLHFSYKLPPLSPLQPQTLRALTVLRNNPGIKKKSNRKKGQRVKRWWPFPGKIPSCLQERPHGEAFSAKSQLSWSKISWTLNLVSVSRELAAAG